MREVPRKIQLALSFCINNKDFRWWIRLFKKFLIKWWQQRFPLKLLESFFHGWISTAFHVIDKNQNFQVLEPVVQRNSEKCLYRVHFPKVNKYDTNLLCVNFYSNLRKGFLRSLIICFSVQYQCKFKEVIRYIIKSLYKNSRYLKGFSACENLVVDFFRINWPVSLENITILEIGEISKQSVCSEKKLVKRSFTSMVLFSFLFSLLFYRILVCEFIKKWKFPEKYYLIWFEFKNKIVKESSLKELLKKNILGKVLRNSLKLHVVFIRKIFIRKWASKP